jgi:hypothetical protein
MKYTQFGLFFIFLLISFSIIAQQNHFIYIQADNKQPFYARLDKKVFSSSVSGYLIVSKLKTGTYNFVIGFPKNEWPEQKISCVVGDNDLGFLLKKFGEKGWGFFNLQTLNVLMADDNGKKADVAADIKTDAFSNMLSTVVNDPTIKQNDPVKAEIKKTAKEEVKAEPVNIAAPVQDKVVNTGKAEPSITQVPVQDKVVETPKTEPVINRATIARKMINKSADGMEMVYIDTAYGTQDTVRVFIPADKAIVETKKITPENNNNITVQEDIKAKEQAPAPVKEEVKKDVKFLEIELPNPNTNAGTVKPDSGFQQSISKSPMINSDCRNFATNEDFLKLRKKMAEADNADEMISRAKKIFKTKCFTTEQVKNLSVLFLKDEGKYNFFDTAYPFASDSQNYVSLQSQLTDTYYIDRFKVMIRH